MHAALMHMYCTEKLNIIEYFRAELSRFMSWIKRTNEKYIHNMYVHCEVGKYPLSLPIYTPIYYIVYSSSNTEHYFPGVLLPRNGPWRIGWKILFSHIWKVLTGEMIYYYLLFTWKYKPRGCESDHPLTYALQSQ